MQVPPDTQVQRGIGKQGPDCWLIRAPEGVFIGWTPDGHLRFFRYTEASVERDVQHGHAWCDIQPDEEAECSRVYQEFRLWRMESPLPPINDTWPTS
jgi:hypothetical protein